MTYNEALGTSTLLLYKRSFVITESINTIDSFKILVEIGFFCPHVFAIQVFCYLDHAKISILILNVFSFVFFACFNVHFGGKKTALFLLYTNVVK